MSTRSPLRWPKHKPPLATDSPSPKLSFNAIFGLRAKKPPSPEPRCASACTEASSIYTNRPPSKSVSSTRSPVDSLCAKTPGDLRESRQSLLTLSDHDPFAGGVTVATPPHSSNRLSTQSNNGLPDVIGGKRETTALFPTTPSQERSLSPDSALFAGYSAPACSGPTLKKLPDAPYSRFVAALGTAFPTAPEKLTKSDPCATLTDPPVTSAMPVRSPMRPRGLTESAMTHRSRSAVPSPGTPSRCISRQVSLARLGIPPSAPPSQELPPPPTSPVPLDSNTSGTRSDTLPMEPGQPSSPSFSAPSDAFPLCSTRRKGKLPDLVPTSPEKPSMPTRKLKKAVSHNSIAKLSISISPLEPSPIRTDEDQEKYHAERLSCKQRSFQSRLPALPIMTSSPSRCQSPTSGSNSSLTSRRRLFSATRRPSICQSNSTEDDAQSIFSLRSEQNIPLSPSRPWIGPSSHSPSFGDDGASDEPSSPQLGNKYTPQHIMSPAAMAEVEASVEFIASPRSRGLSITTITSSKDKDDELSSPATSPALSPFSSSDGSSTLPSRSSSLLFKGSSSPPLRTVTRPSTSQASATSITNGQSSYQPSSSPPLSLMSLPPPPRPRQRTTTAPSSSKAPSDIRQFDGLQPFSRPPSSSILTTEVPLRHETVLPTFLRPPSKVSPDVQFHRDTGFQTTFLQPPSKVSIDPLSHHDTSFQTFSQRPLRRSLLPKTSLEKFFRRRSLLRKPSFLEIDDEAPQEAFDQCDSAASLGDSFLDLTRESFDMNAE